MKTLTLSLMAAFLMLSFIAFSQEPKTVFETASFSKTANNSPCVALGWKKGAENTAYYLVERSMDGNEFKTIALVFTAEDADFVNYQYKDKSFSASNNAVYYRITIVNDKKELTCLPVKKLMFSPDVNGIFTGDFSKDVAKR